MVSFEKIDNFYKTNSYDCGVFTCMVTKKYTIIDIYDFISLGSETLTGVTQSKIGDVCLFIGERAKRARQY